MLILADKSTLRMCAEMGIGNVASQKSYNASASAILTEASASIYEIFTKRSR